MRFIPALLLPILFTSISLAEDHSHAAPPAAGGEAAGQGFNGQQALNSLMAGNQRFVNDLMNKQHKNSDRRIAVAKGQHPVAIIVSCSDSRVPPEQVFDVGLGDIFVIRVAGNVIDDVAIGSIEYAAAHLHVPLILVLGHERCGAVTAAISGEAPPGHVGSIVDKILANLGTSAPRDGDKLDQAVRVNAQAVAHQLAGSMPLLKPIVASGEIMVVAARYDLDDGVVDIIR